MSESASITFIIMSLLRLLLKHLCFKTFDILDKGKNSQEYFNNTTLFTDLDNEEASTSQFPFRMRYLADRLQPDKDKAKVQNMTSKFGTHERVLQANASVVTDC